MKNILKVLSILVLLVCPLRSYPMAFEMNLLGGAGVTLVDIATAADENPLTLEDWNTFSWSVRGQGLFRLSEKAAIGAEIGYQHLYWYYVIIPWVPSNIYRDLSISVMNFSTVMDYHPKGAFFLQSGLGGYRYNNGTAFGLMGAVGYDIRLSRSLSIPVMVRVDLIFATGTTIPVALTTGTRIQF